MTAFSHHAENASIGDSKAFTHEPAVGELEQRNSIDPQSKLNLRLIAELIEEPVTESLLRALGLYRIALDAHRAGQRIAIVDQDGNVIREVTGIVNDEVMAEGAVISSFV